MTSNDYVIPSIVGGLPQLDVESLVKLSEQEFADWYLATMSTYFTTSTPAPRCWNCSTSIEIPTDFRRYYGRSLHAQCFATEYIAERDSLIKRDRDYFDLVARIRTTR